MRAESPAGSLGCAVGERGGERPDALELDLGPVNDPGGMQHLSGDERAKRVDAAAGDQVKRRAHVGCIAKEIIWPILAPMVEGEGYQLIGVWDNGFRQITSNVRAIDPRRRICATSSGRAVVVLRAVIIRKAAASLVWYDEVAPIMPAWRGFDVSLVLAGDTLASLSWGSRSASSD